MHFRPEVREICENTVGKFVPDQGAGMSDLSTYSENRTCLGGGKNGALQPARSEGQRGG